MRRHPHALAALALALLLASTSVALAVTPASHQYIDDVLGFRFNYPWAWSASPQRGPDGSVSILFQEEAGLAVLLAQPLAPADAAYFLDTPRATLTDEIWSGFAPEVPGSQVSKVYDMPIGEQVATVIEFTAQESSGALLYLLHDSVMYTLAFVATSEGFGPFVAGFQEIGGTLAWASGPNPPVPGTPSGSNPLAPGGTSGSGNPLAPPGP